MCGEQPQGPTLVNRYAREWCLKSSVSAVLQVRLWQVGKLMPAKLAGHMEEHGCLPVLYLSAWLLTAYASAFPLTFAARVVDVMLTDSYAEPMMKVCRFCGHRRTEKSAGCIACVCYQNEGLSRASQCSLVSVQPVLPG